MSETEFINLIHRYLTGESTPAQIAKVERWIKASPENQKAFEIIKKIWEVEPEKELRANLKSAWQDLESKMHEKERLSGKRHYGQLSQHKAGRMQKHVWFRAAAFLIVGVLISLFTLWFAGGGFFMN